MTDLQQQAPPVVAVVVAHRPGPWFDETLASLAAQDYPNVRCLVLDTAGDADLAARVEHLIPGSFVRPGRSESFAAACNDALKFVTGSGFLAFVHDDISLAPDAIRLLLEEAYRSNVGVAAPKLVDWDQPNLLSDVGFLVDKFGDSMLPFEPGELDQEQHDAVADRFFVSSACLLIRSDLFRALGGFDEEMIGPNDDLDLCWRAHLSGARVLIVPAAVGKHRSGRDRTAVDTDHRAERNRIRAVLGNYSGAHLVRIIPQLAVVTVVSAIANVVAGRPRRALALLSALLWNGSRIGSLARKRASTRALRQVGDSDVRRLQQRGSARASAFIRGRSRKALSEKLASSSRSVLADLRRTSNWANLAVWGLLFAFLGVGARDVLTGRAPVIGRLLPSLPATRALLSSYWSGWRTHGMGQTTASPSGVGVAAVVSGVFLGKEGLARTVLMIGPLLFGWLGMWRLCRPFNDARARFISVVVYALIPLAAQGFEAARWGGALVYGALPWIVSWLVRASGLVPFNGSRSWPAVPQYSFVARIALVVAAVASFSPVILAIDVSVTIALFVAITVTGGRRSALRVLTTGLGAAAGAVLLHLPWTLSAHGLLHSNRALHLASSLRWIDALRLSSSSAGWRLGGLLVVGAAALTLLIADGWRLAWALRAAALAITSSAMAWAGSRGHVPLVNGELEALLVPGAVGVALLAGLGACAFTSDIRERTLSWRQPVLVGATLALGVGLAPGLTPVTNGRWGMPTRDAGAALRSLRFEDDPSTYRSLWVGEAEAVPGRGWPLVDGFAFSLTYGISPLIDDAWESQPGRAEDSVAQALRAVSDGLSNRLGRLLGPAGIRYVILPRTLPNGDVAVIPDGLETVLHNQLDLREIVSGSDTIRIFENLSFVPVRAQLSTAATQASTADGMADLVRSDLSGSTAALLDVSLNAQSFSGSLEAGKLFVSLNPDPRWSLVQKGATAVSKPAFGWASSYDAVGGPARLSYRTDANRRLFVLAQLMLCGGAVWLARNRRQPKSVGVDGLQIDDLARSGLYDVDEAPVLDLTRVFPGEVPTEAPDDVVWVSDRDGDQE